jgi:methanol metabolism-related c-type cytochrome
MKTGKGWTWLGGMLSFALLAGGATLYSATSGEPPEETVANPAAGAPAVTELEPEKPYTITDGKVDWGTYNGYRRYHSECHVCHGPAGNGSSFAPSLVDSLEVLTYEDFIEVVVNGRSRLIAGNPTPSVMPAFGTNPNVVPYVDDLYAYLKARSDGVVGTARPPHVPKKVLQF